MGLSHALFPEMYRAYYKLHRGELLPNSKEKQILAQNEVLEELINMLPFVKYGTENNINLTADHLQNLQKLNTVTYEEIYPFIKRTWEGEENVLWYGKTEWFAKSSGTTNAKSKYIPVSTDSIDQNHILAGKDMLGSYLKRNPNSKIGFDSVINITGSIQERNEIAKTHAGDISTILDLHAPWYARLSKVLPKSILEIGSWEERLPKIIEFLKDSDVKAFIGTVTWIHIILDQIVKKNDLKNALEIWPKLEVFFHGAVSMKPYINEFKKLIPTNKFTYVEVYNASEGFFAFQDTDDHKNGMLLLCGHGIFYEFIDIKTKQIYTLKDVKLNEQYELVISTVSGLWRYRIGDVIEITNIDPIRIKIIGRTKAVLNAYGEELMVDNVDEAIKQINNKNKYSVGEYTGCPIFKNENNNNGGHEWVIEFEKIPDDINDFIELFDKKLCNLNSDYNAKRTGDIVLKKPIVHPVLKGTFYEWMKNRNKFGGQNKVPRLSESREYVEDLLRVG